METDTEIPSELAGPIPRTVFINMDGDGQYVLIIVLLFFLGGLALLSWIGYGYYSNFNRRAALRGSGVREVVGEVTGFTWGRDSPMSVDYKFPVDGVDYWGQAVEPAIPGPGTRLEQGDHLVIRFLPSNPGINHPDAWEWSWSIGWVSTTLLVFLTPVGCVGLGILLRQRTLARSGKGAIATVTSCSQNGQWFRMEYEFHVQDGTTATGSRSVKNEYAVGARIAIVFLPNKPRRNQIYPLDLYSVA